MKPRDGGDEAYCALRDILMGQSTGPLEGLKVIEMVGIGPGPHCAMLLADLGAEVIRFDRPGGNGWPNPIVDRGRHTLVVDISKPQGRDLCAAAAQKADVLIEGFRPGVMERHRLGPEDLMTLNPRLIYARMTGWGQSGPMANRVGHDINYIGLTGALAAMATSEGPARPPLNLVGDFGGGSMLLAFGIMAALWERNRSGAGQVVDAAIVDGVSSLMTMFAGLLPSGAISVDADRGVLNGAAPFYRAYRCADGLDISVGALEPRFYETLIEKIGAPREFLNEQNNVETWKERSKVIAALIATKTRAQWCEILENTETCFAPVLTLQEAQNDTHLLKRGTYVDVDGAVQCAPVPRFSRTPGTIRTTGTGEDALRRWGVAAP
jgi:alpha-methylacyl-CoA racemase